MTALPTNTPYLAQIANLPGLSQGLNNLQNYNSRMNDEHMQKVYSANPQFAQGLYGLKQNQAVADLALREEQRKLQQQEALKKLATTFSNGPVDRQSALAQYGAITGDLTGLLGVGTDQPSAVREYQYYASLTPEQQQQYRAVKRSQQVLDLGGGFGVLEPTGSVTPVAQKGLAPADQPDNAAAKVAAQENARLGEQLKTEPAITAANAEAGKVGAAQGDAKALLQAMEASMPSLNQVTTKLSALGKLATYTMAGQSRDALVRQIGMDVPDSAVARTEYISTIDNEVLPLLRQTFGAAFTEKEGESLKATLGDPNKSPAEKDAALKSFIEAKQRQVQSLQRQTGSAQTDNLEGKTATGPNGQKVIRRNGAWVPM